MASPWTMHTSNVDDEAPKDPRICQPTHQEFTEKDFEGHRAHTVFVGVHVPGGSRRHSHRRHKHHHREDGEKIPDTERPRAGPVIMTRRRMSIAADDGEILTPPAQRVQFILGEDIDDGTHESHPLFSEMEVLVKEGDEIEWKEAARWIKFEEDVEEGGNRWSKPHVATLSLHSLFELRSLLLNGTVILDMDASSLETIADLVCENMVNAGSLPQQSRDQVKDALLRRHRHQHETKKKDNMSRLPIIRSLAEIGRNHSSSKNLQHQQAHSAGKNDTGHSLHNANLLSTFGLDEQQMTGNRPQNSLFYGSKNDQRGGYLAVPTGDINAGNPLLHSGSIGVTTWLHAGSSTNYCRSSSAPRVDDQSSTQGLTPSTLTLSGNSSNKSIGPTTAGNNGNGNGSYGRFLSVPGKTRSLVLPNANEKKSKSSKMRRLPEAEEMIKSPSSQSMMHRNISSSELNDHRGNTHFMRKIPQGAEASNILVGEVDFLEKTLSGFIRLKQASVMGDLTEVPVPTRFLFILLGPPSSQGSFHEIGRAMATLMSDEIFHEVAYRARKRDHLLAGIDEFLDAVTVLPPGEWDPTIRIEPPAAIPSQEIRKRPPEKEKKEEVDEEEEEQRLREESGLSRTGQLFGGLKNDFKRKVPWYISDFKDALSMQCVASWIFLYFACLSPIITFGGLLSEATGKNMAAMESLVSGFVCGIGYGFFSGQPLTILGSTGPVLVFETIVYDFCLSQGWDYMSFRFWIGTWIVLILLILVAIDASALVCYITRFTEENFATLIAFIFIYKAIENVLSIGKQFPINPANPYDCVCTPPIGSNDTIIEWAKYDRDRCMSLNGNLVGADCGLPEPSNVFLMSIILFLGTFVMSIILKDFKNALFFPSSIRQIISDFSVIIAIFTMSFLDFLMNVATPKLEVPHEFKPTLSTRSWIIPPFNGNPVWTPIIAVFPALLGTILIFMDQQITAVIINRKENKLKKGCGYHLDLFILAILIQICSIMGLPWFVAATVLSINHVNSLKLESECAAPGEKPQFLGVREQRATHIMIFFMIGSSVLLTPILCHIPMPVLFGVFLYMGVASLKGLQFFDRILIMFMPNKYQPDYMFLRQVPIKRVHIFTLIQLACLIILWLIKSFPQTSILFPLMLVVMIGIRKSLDLVFTRRELKILDDIMPEMTKRAVADDLHQLEDGTAEDNNGNHPPHHHHHHLNDAYTSSATNIHIPLGREHDKDNDNGKVIEIPINSSSINITEEVNKTTIWKQVNNDSLSKSYLNGQNISATSITDQIIIPVPLKARKPNGSHQHSNENTNGKTKTVSNPTSPNSRLSTMTEEDEVQPMNTQVIKENGNNNNDKFLKDQQQSNNITQV